MSNQTEAWVLVVDSEQARLLRATAIQHGRVQIDEVLKLAPTYQEAEHQRPTRLGQPGHGGASRREPAHEQALFAREISAWLAPELLARSIAHCNLFAPPHLLGALRAELPKPVAAKLHEHAMELANLSPAELAKHPSITKLLASQQDAGSHMA
ncbi:MAG: host attachment protein [Planctomycetes bacterium]|nr:host attachment protein [Planctomycetota bacterium]